ncbi:MAG: methyltransferase domain-containing protein [Planctomycetota bacterium]
MSDTFDSIQYAKSLGYSEDELRSVPEGLVCHGCGNSVALAELQEGETVLDLGSGDGLDAFLAAKRVGPAGGVIGVDVSVEKIAKATEAASKGGYANIVFKVGRMERLPLEEASVDVVISNCVVNHAADKLAVFREVRRCLRPDGRLVVTDLVAEGGFSQAALSDEMWGEWLGVALGKQEYLLSIEKAGFRNLMVVSETVFPMAEQDERLRGRIVSIGVKAYK